MRFERFVLHLIFLQFLVSLFILEFPVLVNGDCQDDDNGDDEVSSDVGEQQADESRFFPGWAHDKTERRLESLLVPAATQN